MNTRWLELLGIFFILCILDNIHKFVTPFPMHLGDNGIEKTGG